MSKEIKIVDKTFKNKTQLTKYIKDYLKNNNMIQFEDYEFFKALASQHPRGLKENETVIIAPNTQYGKTYNNITIVKSNGTYDYYSYDACINGYNHNYDIKSYLRKIIYPDIEEFKINNIKPNICELCGNYSDEFEVDHIILFNDLVNQFMNKYNININDIKIENKQIINDIINNEFPKFHHENAKLRWICKKCNQTQKKK